MDAINCDGGGQADLDEMLRRARGGDAEAINSLFAMNRQRLVRMVRCRLDPRLYGRVDDSDVIQEAYLEAARRLDDYFQQPRAPFFLWLRSLVGYKLLEIHGRHLGVAARSVAREISNSTIWAKLNTLTIGWPTREKVCSLRLTAQSGCWRIVWLSGLLGEK